MAIERINLRRPIREAEGLREKARPLGLVQGTEKMEWRIKDRLQT